jgi:DHA2 family multidrug resistance protein
MTTTPTLSPPTGVRRWAMMAAGTAGSLVYVFALGAIGMALPHMQGAFSAAPDQIAWVVTAFIVAATLTMAVSGWFSARFGRRRVFLICIAGFTLSSIFCALADDLMTEVLARALQGLFAAPLSPLGQAIAIDAFPRERQGFATSLWALGSLWGSFLGPFAGGYLVELYGWPSIFYVIAASGVVSGVLSWVSLPETPREPERPLDWVGFGALTVFIGALTLTLSRGERADWFASTEIVVLAAVALIGLYVFIVHSLTTRRPFLDSRLLRDRNYVVAVTLMFVHGMYNFLPLFVLPLLLNGVMGYPLRTIGVVISMRAFGVVIGVLLIARLVDKVDPRILVLFGFVCLMIPQWAMSGWNQDVGWWDITLAMILQGIGSGVPFVTISTVAFSTLPTGLRTEGMSFFHLVNSLGIAMGATLIFNLVARFSQASHASLTAHVSPFNALFRSEVPGQVWGLGQRTDLAALSAEIARQSTMIAFNNAFFVSAVIGISVLPLVLLLRVERRS